MRDAVEARSQAERMLAHYLPVASARFVDAGRESALARLGIETVGDLLCHVPFRFLDLRHTAHIGRAPIGEVTVIGSVHAVITKRPRRGLTVTEVHVVDDSGLIVGVWFNQPWVEKTYTIGERLALSGTLAIEYGYKRIVQPFVERLDHADGGSPSSVGRILPVHRTTEKLALGWLRRIIGAAVDDFSWVPEPLPAAVRHRRHLMGLGAAYRAAHFPETPDIAAAARHRLAYQEALEFLVSMLQRRRSETVDVEGIPHSTDGPALSALAGVIPFTLTSEQAQAVAEVLADMARSYPMRRMLLGDVGTGKTLVAAHALCAAIDSGTQAAMMAPTEVLAKQYASSVGELLTGIGVPWAVLTGSMTASQQRDVHEGIESGALGVVFGTHALIQDRVTFRNLGLVVVDEQHRFGVAQRRSLNEKGLAPDVLVMTATPIPRSLALTAYGDLAVSTLRTRPVAGAGVTTQLVKKHQAYRAHQAVLTAVGQGRQAYVVCPAIEQSDKTEWSSVRATADELKNNVFAHLRVEELTGKMSALEKDDTMSRFRGGQIDVLVATTVIEVGVDVPNATVMIVYDADRFGLAQLHQLRGRVGRGAHPGEVWLVSDSFAGDARARLDALVSTTDGFALAEMDLQLRGAGELLGERQHGVAGLRVANLAKDIDIIEAARADAETILGADPELSGPDFALLGLRVQQFSRRLTQSIQAGG